jgi:2-amino-4-hydroxy-6-hydroxymethyldihydropteridine diphosphokinase
VSDAEHDAFIGLGSNLGDPTARVRAAIAALDDLTLTRVVVCSSLYRSAPVGYADQPDFINAVARVATELGPRELLDALLALERAQGRVRTIPNGPRTLDLDLLLYDQLAVHEPSLIVPHPRMHERAFVLVPLAEIASTAAIPGRGRVVDVLASVTVTGIRRLPG